jgi:hypothetical protein
MAAMATVIAFHAHPDDEVLLTGGTVARGRAGRLFQLLVALPAPLFGLVCGREWFAEPGAAAATRKIGDILQPAASSCSWRRRPEGRGGVRR